VHHIEDTGKVESMTTAAERLMAPGPEEQQLAERAGTWNVVECEFSDEVRRVPCRI
jgi:hypothetical protein